MASEEFASSPPPAAGDTASNPSTDAESTRSSGKKSLLWCRWIARRPKLMFGLTGAVHISFVVITVALLTTNYNILPLVFDDLPLELNKDEIYLREEAWDYRNEDLKGSASSARRRRRWVSEVDHDDLPTSVTTNQPTSDFQNFQLHVNLNSLEKYTAHIPDLLQNVRKDVSLFGKSRKYRWRRNTNMQNSSRTTYERNDTTSDVDIDGWVEEAEDDILERQKQLTALTIVYEVPGGNVFTQENLRRIAELETYLYNMKEFQLDYCRLVSTFGSRSCQPFTSVLRFFDGTYSDTHDDLFDPNFKNISKVLNLAYSHPDTKEQLKYFLGKRHYFNAAAGVARSDLTRTSIAYGYPLRSYGNHTDRREEQLRKFGNWFSRNVKPHLQTYRDAGDMKLYFINFRIYYNDVFEQVLEDWKLLIGAFSFIFLFTWFQTGSLWISGIGICSILTSFLGANLLYNVVFGYKYFGIFNVMAIFIILGIGADDIFIFTDSWTATKIYANEKLEYRLSVCYRKAAVAMFVTSLTTMTAFFLSGLSPILPLAGFGIFSGLTILVNYVSVITFFPTVVVIHHIYFENKRCLCCCEKSKAEIEEELTDAKTENGISAVSHSKENGGTDHNSVVYHRQSRKDSPVERPKTCSVHAYVVYFFASPFYKFVIHKIGRVLIIIVSAALVGFAIYSCTNIKLEDSRIKMFGPNHVQEIAADRVTYGFVSLADEPLVIVRLVWGMGPQDKSMCPDKVYEADEPCKGKTVWQPDFTMNKPEHQMELLKFCEKMRDLKGEEREKLNLLHHEKTNRNNFTCFIEHMRDFFKNESSKSQYPEGVSLELPINMEKVKNLIKYNPKVYRAGAEKIITHPFEIAVDYWLHYGYTNESTPDEILEYRSHLGFRNLNRYNLANNDEDDDDDFGIRGGRRKIYPKKLMFMSAIATTARTFRSLGLPSGLSLMDTWEKFITKELKQLPGSLKEGFQTNSAWVWFRILQSIIIQGLLSVGVGLALAFVVILLGTQNIITALLSVLCLTFVCVCVFAVIPLMGWKFGLIEAMNTCLVVGLAVDYVVHTAEGYHLNRFTTRNDRLQDALHHVGISVLSGAITTAGASFFTLFAQVLFFQQFGMFIFCTIVFSLLFSLFTLCTLFGVVGPQGYTGSFMKICKKDKKESKDVKGQVNAGYENDMTKI